MQMVLFSPSCPPLLSRDLPHVGSPMELMYDLQTFGISPDQIPINSNTGKVKNQYHLKWISMRQAMEEAKASAGSGMLFPGIQCPSHLDVLLGRGRPIVNHRGNVAMRQRVEARLARFATAAGKDEKAAIVWEVVHETYLSNGRFLKEDPGKHGWWEEVDQEVAKAKVSVYFRDLKCTLKEMPSPITTTLTATSSTCSVLGTSSVGDKTIIAEAGSSTTLAKATISARRQEFDSSTYDFLEAWSTRGGKRSKLAHCGESSCWSFN
jgi:hypothetical protein